MVPKVDGEVEPRAAEEVSNLQELKQGCQAGGRRLKTQPLSDLGQRWAGQGDCGRVINLMMVAEGADAQGLTGALVQIWVGKAHAGGLEPL